MKNVYSCSMPNSGSWSSNFSATGAQQRPRVRRVRRHVGEEHLAHHELVVAAADRVRAENTGCSTQSELLPGRLVGARAVEAPDRRARRRRRGSWSSTAAWASARCRRSRCIQPCSVTAAPRRRRSWRSPDASAGLCRTALQAGDFPSVARCERSVNGPRPRPRASSRQPCRTLDAMEQQLDYVLRTVEERGVRFVRLWFTDVLGSLKSFAITPAELETALEEGMTFDGSAIEGYSRVQESDMLAVPDPNTFEIVPWRGDDAPVGAHVLRHPAPLRRAVRGRPALRAASATSTAPARRASRSTPARRWSSSTSSRPTTPDAARPRRLLRPHPDRHGERPAQADDPHARGDGHPGRVQLPRDRPEPARDRPALHRRAHDGRQRDDVPDRRASRSRRTSACTRRSCRSRSRARSARACTRTSRCSRATSTRSTTPATSTGCRRSASASSPACCATRARSPRSRTRRSTPTSGSSSGYEAPVYVCWARNNRVGARAGADRRSGARRARTRIEFRSPDPACNPYLAFSVMLAAGLKGIEEGYELPPEATNNIFEMTPEERAAEGIGSLPAVAGRGDRRHGGLRARRRGARRARVRVLHPQQARASGTTTSRRSRRGSSTATSGRCRMTTP